MKPVLTLTTYSQLKALSDPLRAEMMIRLCERPYTGQLLSEKFGISRAKIHFRQKGVIRHEALSGNDSGGTEH